MSLAELLEKKKAKLNNVPPPPEKNCSYLVCYKKINLSDKI